MRAQPARVFNIRQTLYHISLPHPGLGRMKSGVASTGSRSRSPRASAALSDTKGDGGCTDPWPHWSRTEDEQKRELGEEGPASASGGMPRQRCCAWLMDHSHLKHKNKAACQRSLGRFH